MLPPAVEFMDSRDLGRFAYAREWRRLASVVISGSPLEVLGVEYVRLFGAGVSGTPATPTESFYRVPKHDGGVGDFVARLQSEYRQMGLTWTGTYESPDHIATELDAMSYLCGLEAEAWDRGSTDKALAALRNQGLFLDRHLAVWVPLFVEKARGADPGPYYGAVLDFLHSYVVHEKSISSILLRELEKA